MKLVSTLLLISVLAYVFGRWPFSPFAGELNSIEIFTMSETGNKKEYMVSAKSDIDEIKVATGRMWFEFLPSGSNEGLPKWILTTNYKDGTVKKHYIDEDEFNRSFHSNTELISLLKKKYN